MHAIASFCLILVMRFTFVSAQSSSSAAPIITIRREFGIGIAQNGSNVAIQSVIGEGWSIADAATARLLPSWTNLTFLGSRRPSSGARVALSQGTLLVSGSANYYHAMYFDLYAVGANSSTTTMYQDLATGFIWNNGGAQGDSASLRAVSAPPDLEFYGSSSVVALYTRVACASPRRSGDGSASAPLPTTCEACIGNLQWASGCSTCSTPLLSPDDHCTTCANRGDATAACTTCRNKALDIASSCRTCKDGNHLAAPQCETCSAGPRFSVASNCTACSSPQLDFRTNCTRCLNPVLDPLSDCVQCLNSSALDPATNCTTCTASPRLTPASRCVSCSSSVYSSADYCNSCANSNLIMSSNCTRCADAELDPATNCRTCLRPNVVYRQGQCICERRYRWEGDADPATNCTTCVNRFLTVESRCFDCANPAMSPWTRCRECIVRGQDPSTNCTTCVNDRYAPSSNCKKCIDPLFEVDTYCSCFIDTCGHNSVCCQFAVVGIVISSIVLLVALVAAGVYRNSGSNPVMLPQAVYPPQGTRSTLPLPSAAMAQPSRRSAFPEPHQFQFSHYRSPANNAETAESAAPRTRPDRHSHPSRTAVIHVDAAALHHRGNQDEDSFYHFIPLGAAMRDDSARSRTPNRVALAADVFPDDRSETARSATCTICMDRPAHAALMPCGHSAFCVACVRRLRCDAAPGRRTMHCPLCRGTVTHCLVAPPM